jgi:hypothetical protein
MTDVERHLRGFAIAVVLGTSACSGSHPVAKRDSGTDAAVTAIDARVDAAADAGRSRRDAGLIDDHCAMAGTRFPDGTLQPVCDARRLSCDDPVHYPHWSAVCEFGLCCGGRVDPTTCECRCGAGPPCTGGGRWCCRPENYPHLDHLDRDAFYCLLENDCAEF